MYDAVCMHVCQVTCRYCCNRGPFGDKIYCCNNDIGLACPGAHEAQERTQAPLQTNLIAYSSHAETPKEWFYYPNSTQPPPSPTEGSVHSLTFLVSLSPDQSPELDCMLHGLVCGDQTV